MKKIALVMLSCALVFGAQAKKKKKCCHKPSKECVAPQGATTVNKEPFKNANDSLMYAIGNVFGKNLLKSIEESGLKLDSTNINLFTEAVKASILNKNSQIDLAKSDELINNYFEKMNAEKNRDANAKIEINKAKGAEYMAANAKKSGVITAPEGYQYEVITPGDGKNFPKETSTVKVHYTGKLINGQIFDSSVMRGQPTEFGLNQVIKGWTLGVQKMSLGSKYIFTIPSNLAYGDRGAGGDIGGGETLIFEVELLEIK